MMYNLIVSAVHINSRVSVHDHTVDCSIDMIDGGAHV